MQTHSNDAAGASGEKPENPAADATLSCNRGLRWRKDFARRDDGPCRGRREEALRQGLSIRCIMTLFPSHSADLMAGSSSLQHGPCRMLR